MEILVLRTRFHRSFNIENITTGQERKLWKDYLGYGKIKSGMERKCIKILPRVWKENVLKDYLGYGKKMY